MKKILLIEDAEEIFLLVQHYLAPIAEIQWADSLASARQKLKEVNYDLILLDMGLPDGDGAVLCSELQNTKPEVPVFFLTSHTKISEKVFGFSVGAEDYITKPFEPLELKARVEARLKRSELYDRQANQFKWKELEVNTLTQQVKVTHTDKMEDVELTAREFKLLMYFIRRKNHVINRNQILEDIWGKDVHVYSRSVDTHVSKLRKKLGPVASVINSVHGSGYKFKPTPL